jgi:rsbT co-antagonist protein RsbR
MAATTLRRDLMDNEELKAQSRRFLGALRKVLQNGGADQDITAPAWEETRALLGDISQSRARQGFSPSETATFVFSLKRPLSEDSRCWALARCARRTTRWRPCGRAPTSSTSC